MTVVGCAHAGTSDIEAYLFALRERILGQRLVEVRVGGSFFLRTVTPRLDAADGRKVLDLRRVGKRVAIGLEGGLWLVVHLMIAGRLHWKAPGVKLGGRNMLASFDFESAASPSPKPGQSGVRRSTWSKAKRGWRRSIRAASMCWAARGRSSKQRCRPRIER